MNSSIRVGTLFGIPFYVNPSWFLVLGLVTVSYGSGLAAQFPSLPVGIPLMLGFVTALLLFASVLAHELGHSFVAQHQGIGVQSITLFLFGGLASLEKESRTPAEAFWVAIAGPLVSLVLFGVLTTVVVTTPVSGPLAAIISLLAYINLMLGLFNLIPGLPLDGGNILKAIVWKITGNPYKGIRFASRVGQLLGWLAIVSGVLPLITYSGSLNFWNVLIGWFLLQNAGQSAQFAAVQEQLSGLTAADVVTPNSPIVTSSMSLREFADQRIVHQDLWRKFLVTDAEGQLIGELSVSDLKSVASNQWTTTTVGDLTKPMTSAATVVYNQPLMDVIKRLEESQLSTLAVIGNNGVLLGLLEKASIVKLLQQPA
ncbi:MAG: site-2 protease family protein [Cyanobacteria bacterium]|nr:site-2 protease family protein [Cyanobacteriota bacterium]MDW8202268.1 site-2 protease family protein [Cyanobacteriota bacterium SKYGB_h_bin112]